MTEELSETAESSEEEILITQPSLYRWIGTETNATMLSAIPGVVMVTNRRLCFLTSIGLSDDDINEEDDITSVIDRYLEDSSCFGLPYDQIASVEVLQRWDAGYYLRVMGIDENDDGFAYCFMSRYGLNPSELHAIEEQVSQRITSREIDPELVEDLALDSVIGKHRFGIPLFGLVVLLYAMFPQIDEVKEFWSKREVTAEVYTKISYFNADVKLLDTIDKGDLAAANEMLETLQIIRDDNCYVNCNPIYARPHFDKVDR